MKFLKVYNLLHFLYVRPLAGAGIEIFNAVMLAFGKRFAPSRGRELKSDCDGRPGGMAYVRPLAGAGIEIFRADNKKLAAGSPPRGGGN